MVKHELEDRIEARVERRMDVLDRAFTRGDISEADYDLLVRELNCWSERCYSEQRVA